MALGRVTLLVSGGILFLSMLFTPDLVASGPTVCWYKESTGLDCLGCGLTRGFTLFSHGEFRAAVALNPLIVVLYPLCVLVFFLSLAKVGWGYQVPWPKTGELPNGYYLVLVLAVTFFWLHRLFSQVSL
jgi:hypothetical protein